MTALAGAALLALVATATAAAGQPDGQKAWKAKSATEQGTVRALSAAQVRKRGLQEHVDMSRYRARAPEVGVRGRPSPRAGDGARASTCWEHWYGEGVFSGVFTLYGKTDVTWCGDGEWISYTSSRCSGVDGGYPTYEYLGCERETDYGEGWNVYDVWSQWHLCIAWVPSIGCASDQYPQAEYRYGAAGGVWRL